MRWGIVFLLIPFLAMIGCITALPDKDTAIISNSNIQQLKARISDLETELKKQQEENISLRQQLETANKTEIRMPTGKEIQTALKQAGFYQGEIDGQVGSKTKEAIKKFQEANGLNPDGVVGSRTWEILAEYPKTKTR